MKLIISVVFLQLLMWQQVGAEIQIAHGPEDVTVTEGGSAVFPCFITGTSDVPFWIIGGSVHNIEDLPNRHSYSNWTLKISDVRLSDNGTGYQCSLFIVVSDIAVLFVNAAPEASAEIQITYGPENITVTEGGFAMFHCFVIGTMDMPFWVIGGSVHNIEDLPTRHSYSNWTLTISDVQISDSGTTYQCSLSAVISNIAVLIVNTAPEAEVPSTELNSRPSLPSFFPANQTSSVNSTTLSLKRNAKSDHEITIITSVFACIIIGALVVAIMLLMGYLKWAHKNTEKADVAEYEEVKERFAEPRLGVVACQTSFALDINACYSLKEDPVYSEIGEAIDTKLNDAYGSRQLQANTPKPPTDLLPPRPLDDQNYLLK